MNAWRGIREVLFLKSKIWIALGAGTLALLGAWVFRLPPLAAGLILWMAAAIVSAEMFNTALEALEDIVFPEYREAVRRSKDLAAGAVLVLAAGAALVGVLIFLPPILAFLLY